MKIKNNWQYRQTKGEIERLRGALDNFDNAIAAQAGIHPSIIQAQRDGLHSQIETIETEAEHYETLHKKLSEQGGTNDSITP